MVGKDSRNFFMLCGRFQRPQGAWGLEASWHVKGWGVLGRCPGAGAGLQVGRPLCPHSSAGTSSPHQEERKWPDRGPGLLSHSGDSFEAVPLGQGRQGQRTVINSQSLWGTGPPPDPSPAGHRTWHPTPQAPVTPCLASHPAAQTVPVCCPHPQPPPG